MSEISVYVVRKVRGEYCSRVAKRVATCGSWWHVRHKDGSITKHNGGSPYRENVLDAWEDLIRDLSFRASRLLSLEGIDRMDHEKVMDTLESGMWFDREFSSALEDMWQEVIGYGYLQKELEIAKER